MPAAWCLFGSRVVSELVSSAGVVRADHLMTHRRLLQWASPRVALPSAVTAQVRVLPPVARVLLGCLHAVNVPIVCSAP